MATTIRLMGCFEMGKFPLRWFGPYKGEKMKISTLFLSVFFLAGCIEQPTSVVDESQSTLSLRSPPNAESKHKDKRDKIRKCKKDSVRSVAGCWNVTQYNGNSGLLRIIQTGSVLTGLMHWYTFVDSPLEGNISGDSVTFELPYPTVSPLLIGYYSATLDATGDHLVKGYTYSNQGHTADWDATKTTCPVAP